MNIPKKEEKFREIGLTLPVPINLYILLNSVESSFLNTIRHYQIFQEKYISDSLIRICTGHDKKTIRKAKKSLIAMGIIKILKVTKISTSYEINYEILYNIIKKLNSERSAYKRLIIADEFRGKDRAIHSKLIKEYEMTNFNNIN